MAGSDHLLENTRERWLSTDFNDAQAIKDRVLLDSLRRGLEVRQYAPGGIPAGAPRDCVLGGLEVSPNVGDISISAGALLQDSAVLPPAPGPVDSPYRVAINRAAETVVMPAPGATTYYLLEAQMVEVVTLNEVRDVWDPGLGVFVPTAVDKRLERQINFQITAGVGLNAPAPTGAPWVPIAVVRRPGGGGPVLAADISEVAPRWDDRFPVGNEQFNSLMVGGIAQAELRTTHLPGAAVSNLIRIEAEATELGLPLWFAANAAPFDPTTSVFLDPATVLAANTWYYLYLVPWAAAAAAVRMAPRNAYPGHTGRGLLVLSSSPPAVGDPRSVGGITLPAPWSVAGNILIGEAVCVGAVRRNAANTGWIWSQSMGHRHYQHEQIVVAVLGPPVATQTINLAGFIPRGARSVILHIGSDAGGATVTVMGLRPVGSAGDYINVTFTTTINHDFFFDLSVAASESFDLSFTLNVPAIAIGVSVMGYRT